MNTRIEKDFTFSTGLYFAGEFYINLYEMTLSILVETDSIMNQNTAMERISYFIHEVLQNSILIHQDEKDQITKYKDAHLRLCELPEQPYDMVLANVLLLKLNSILEGKLVITDLILGSTMSEGIRNIVVAEVAENALSGNYWWNKNNTSMTDKTCIEADNIVNLFKSDEWNDLSMSWEEKVTK